MKTFLDIFDAQFRSIHRRSCEFVRLLPKERLYTKPLPIESYSCGECLLRSAAAVEQMSGGISARLWDDPFEWTLPEELTTLERILNYLNEVEQTREKAFAYFASDDDLARELPAPQTQKPIARVLIETIARSEHWQGRAFALFPLVADRPLPAFSDL